MAAKSDFAQKLLRDLRLRKERMGSAHANATAGDGYRNQRNVQIGGSKTTNQQQISSNGSTHIVSYTTRHHQRSEPISDLSMAFTYAVKNGGNTNPVLDFLHQIGRRSLDLGNTRNQKTTTTAIQIKEISKGVQNLYEIIRSSSNGSNDNRYSMEVGKELLKGAKGLEESLRVLVNLQAGSELTVLPKRKSRVTLLEVDDEDKDDRLGQNRVDLPRFSFDKPSRKSNLVLTDGSNKVCTRRKTASCGGESVGSVKNNLGRSEKGRISNIIVKLMGLDEVVEFKNANDLNNNTINTISIPVKDGRKPQYFHDSNENTIKTSKIAKNGVDRNFQQILDAEQSNDRLDQISEKEKIRVQKNYTNRVEKSNEIKLVPRNNKIQEPEKRVQKSKQNSTKTKKTKNTNSAPKEPKTITFEQNPKAKITRKKVDSRVDSRTEAPRTKNEILKPRSKHKLLVLKEPKKKDTKSDENSRRRTESTIGLDNIVSLPMISQVPECEQIKSDPEITSKIIDVGSSERIIETSNISKHKPNKNSVYRITQVLLTENEKQLKEILIKDQLFLSTTEAIFKLNIPVGFLQTDDHIHHKTENKIKLDCGYEILKRKARNQELSAHPYVTKPYICDTKIRLLDELVKQLYKDLESLRLYGRDASNEYDQAADCLNRMVDRDICNKCPDVNSFWDLGWNMTTFTFVEKDEFVNDVERDVVRVLVDEIVGDLLSMCSPF